jgi:hypothetical protein
MTDIDDDFLQFLMDQLNEGYAEYKKNHPDFAKVVEQEEGKPEESYDQEHCKSCGEWLEGYDICGACGMIQK